MGIAASRQLSGYTGRVAEEKENDANDPEQKSSDLLWSTIKPGAACIRHPKRPAFALYPNERVDYRDGARIIARSEPELKGGRQGHPVH